MAQPASCSARCFFKTFDMTSPVCRPGALDRRAAREARHRCAYGLPRADATGDALRATRTIRQQVKQISGNSRRMCC
jgi:hypothetical protein